MRYKLSTEYDLEELVELWELSVKATHFFLKPSDIDYYKKFVPEYVRLSMIYCMVRNNKTAAFIGVIKDKIELLFVHPNHFRRGLGKELVSFVIGSHSVTKVDVNEQNTDAFMFYKSFGFKVIKRYETDSEGKNYPILCLSL